MAEHDDSNDDWEGYMNEIKTGRARTDNISGESLSSTIEQLQLHEVISQTRYSPEKNIESGLSWRINPEKFERLKAFQQHGVISQTQYSPEKNIEYGLSRRINSVKVESPKAFRQHGVISQTRYSPEKNVEYGLSRRIKSVKIESPKAFQQHGLSEEPPPYYPWQTKTIPPGFHDLPSSSSSSSIWRWTEENNFLPPQLINDYGYSANYGGRSPMLSSGYNYNNNDDDIHSPYLLKPRWQHHSRRSPDLEEFRGSIAKAAKDQAMSKLLQERVEQGCPEERRIIFLVVMESLFTLVVHKVGNYLVRKLIAVLDEDQAEEILVTLTNSSHQLRSICTDNYGSKVISALVKRLNGNTAQQTFLITMLSEFAVELTESPKCKQILDSCLANYSCAVMEPFLIRVAQVITEIATDRNGCIALQNCLDFCFEEMKICVCSEQLYRTNSIFRGFVSAIIDNAVFLSEDFYGNYVVQKVIGFKDMMINSEIVSKLSRKFISLSMNKHGSNVVEILLKACSTEGVGQIISEMIDAPKLLQLLLNEFGNYVVQTAIKTAKAKDLEVYSNLLDFIEHHAENLQSNVHGRNVYNLVCNKHRKDQRRSRRGHP